MNKSTVSVLVTAINQPNISKEFNKANGLVSIDINGVSNSLPYYGIISKSGTLELIDQPDLEYPNGWFRTLSDDNILPDVKIDIRLNGVILYSFVSQNDISIIEQDKKVRINLLDSISALQDMKLTNSIYYTNTNAYSVFIDVLSLYNISVSIDMDTKEELQRIILPKVIVSSDSIWDFIENFCNGCRAIFLKRGDLYYLKILGE
jgi:hypothetical protein|nr:MAG TPA: hypothetical protein [Caudoviricetes sp.]